MSNYNARRAPNVSAYLANLNTIPSQHEQATQQDFDFNDGNLDLFANTDFFDFDNTFPPELDLGAHAQPQSQSQSQQQQPQPAQNNAQMSGMATPNVSHTAAPHTDLAPGPGFQFSEFQAFPQALADSPPALAPSPPNGLQGAYPPQQNNFSQPGEKRKASAANVAPVADLEETSRFAAEEDKRRRNTAASARFRVKKKQREAELEKKSKDMADKVSSLENKVHQLEMENKWLKGLITEKSDVKGMEEQFKKFVAEKDPKQDEKEAHRSTELRTDGVGTEQAETAA